MIPFDEQPGAIAIGQCYATLAEGTKRKEALQHLSSARGLALADPGS